MSDDLYQEVILEEYAHPRNTGKLDSFDVQFAERNSSCGDEIEVYLKFDDADKILAVSWVGVGCAISMSAASVLSEHIKGLSRAKISSLTKATLEELLGITDISIGREKCLMLSLNAFQKAVKRVQPTVDHS